MDIITNIIKKHSSLLVLILGAGCFFISNIFLKTKLSTYEYGIYSLIITYLSLIYIYGLLGFEQVLLRYSHIEKNNILLTQKICLYIILTTSILTSIISTIVFKIFYLKTGHYLLFFTTFSMIISMPIFSILRLNKQFTLAQFVANYWKIILFFICIYMLIINQYAMDTIIDLLFLTIIVFTIVLVFYFTKKIRFEFTKNTSTKTIFLTFLFFFISITSFSLITFGDRFIIEEKIDIQTLGSYFFLTNFLLAPFNILQNYVGFKQLVEYKQGINHKSLFTNTIKISIIGLALGIGLCLFAFTMQRLNLVNFNFYDYITEITLFIILGIVKLYSSIVSPAFETNTNIKMLKLFNFSIIFSSIIFITILLYVDKLTINKVLICLILLWFIRSISQHILILKSTKNNSVIAH